MEQDGVGERTDPERDDVKASARARRRIIALEGVAHPRFESFAGARRIAAQEQGEKGDSPLYSQKRTVVSGHHAGLFRVLPSAGGNAASRMPSRCRSVVTAS